MSRRKNLERVQAMKRQNPDYKGFRGYEEEPTRPGDKPLESVKCTVCGRKRNVPVGVAEEQRDAYVCETCREEQEGEPQGEPQVEVEATAEQ